MGEINRLGKQEALIAALRRGREETDPAVRARVDRKVAAEDPVKLVREARHLMAGAHELCERISVSIDAAEIDSLSALISLALDRITEIRRALRMPS